MTSLVANGIAIVVLAASATAQKMTPIAMGEGGART